MIAFSLTDQPHLDLCLAQLMLSSFPTYPEAGKANHIQTQEITISIILMAELTSQKVVCIILIFGYYVLVINLGYNLY